MLNLQAWKRIAVQRLVSIIVLGGLLWNACTTAKIDSSQKIAGELGSNETIAILVSTNSDLERESVECITHAVRRIRPGTRVIGLDEFHRSVFYYGYPDTNDEFHKYFSSLVKEPTVKNRINDRGLHYAISIYGRTEQTGEPLAGGGGGGGGFFTAFGMSWERTSQLAASIFDLRQGADLGTVLALAEGKPWILCVGVGPFCAPIGAAAFTEAKACTGLADAVAAVLTGSATPASAK
jgi:hypothetical protein